MIEAASISTLLGNTTQKSKVGDLISGSTKDVTSALSSVFEKNNIGLTEIQHNTLTNLEDYVNENVEGPEATKLIESIVALRNLMEFGNEEHLNLDPVFSLLSSNPSLIGDAKAGSIIDSLT